MGVTSAGVAKFLRTNASGQLEVSIASGGGGTQYAEDSAHVTGDLGFMMLGVQGFDQPGALGGNGDYEPLQFDTNGRAQVANMERGPNGRPNFYVNLAGVNLFDVPCSIIVDGSTGDTVDVISGAMAVVDQTTAIVGNLDAFAKIAGTALTGSYATLKVVSGANFYRKIFILNSCDKAIQLSFDAGTTTHFELDPNESVELQFDVSRNRYYSGTIQAKHAGVAPTRGSVRYGAIT